MASFFLLCRCPRGQVDRHLLPPEAPGALTCADEVLNWNRREPFCLVALVMKGDEPDTGNAAESLAQTGVNFDTHQERVLVAIGDSSSLQSSIRCSRI